MIARDTSGSANQKPPAGRNAAEGFWLRWTVSVTRIENIGRVEIGRRRVGDQANLESRPCRFRGRSRSGNRQISPPQAWPWQARSRSETGSREVLPLVCVSGTALAGRTAAPAGPVRRHQRPDEGGRDDHPNIIIGWSLERRASASCGNTVRRSVACEMEVGLWSFDLAEHCLRSVFCSLLEDLSAIVSDRCCLSLPV